jgi:hypothetical protein
MLMATMIFFWNLFIHVYKNRIGAFCSVVTVGVSLFVCLSFATYLRFFDPAIKSLKVPPTEYDREDTYLYSGVGRSDSFVGGLSSDSFAELSSANLTANASKGKQR